MTSSLHDRVVEFVAANPGLTSRQVARGVRARLSDVLDVLADQAFSASPRGEWPSDRAQVYQLAPVAPEQLGKAARRGQCELIASVLLDGKPHSTAEIHRRCGFSRLNSRIAELRDPKKRWGMVIRCDHVAGASSVPNAQTYTFLGYLPGFGPGTSSETEGVGHLTRSVSPDAPAKHGSLPADGDTPPVHDAGASDSTQLDIGEAA